MKVLKHKGFHSFHFSERYTVVSQALADGLLNRIQNYVARDINKRIPMEGSDAEFQVKPDDIFINSFSRIQNNWQAVVSARGVNSGYYVLSHNGSLNVTTVYIFVQATPAHEAII